MSTTVASTKPSAEELLTRNLAALERAGGNASRLAARIRLPVDGNGTRTGAGGALQYRLHRSWVALELEPDVIESSVEALAGADQVLVLGIGAGELVERFLHTSRPILAWERDPWLLRVFLSRCDVSAALRSGRLCLLLGTDLLDHAGTDLATAPHPLLGPLYASETRVLRGAPAGRRVVVGAGGLFVEEVRRALCASGCSTWTLDLKGLSREELSLSFDRFRPELLVAINYVDGMAEFCADHGVKLVVWEIDPATTPPRALGCDSSHAHLFTYRASHVEVYRAAGFANVEQLPLAADPELRRPLDLDVSERERWSAPLAHVGSSLVENARACRDRLLARWLRTSCSAEQAQQALTQLLAEQRESPHRFLVPELLEAAAPGLRAAVLAGTGAEDPVLLIGEIAASEKRLNSAARLGPQELSVWGDAGWCVTERFGVRYRGAAGHREELTRIYNASPFHWDIGRIYQQDIVTMRVFDVAACGAVVFAEWNRELAGLFELGVEVESYRDLAELEAKLTHYRAHPDEARELGRRARAAIEERHTIARRVGRMLTALG